jgi:response regulator RpfG family c-di-GMP phosphodiesterase
MSDPSGQAYVLVVDDERGPRESLRMILSPHHHVSVARDASEALTVLRARPVDVVTLDLNMPGLGGQELMGLICDEFPTVEMIVITGSGSLESATEGIRRGISDYLQKPFYVVQVNAAVARALAHQQARSGLRAFLRDLGGVVGRDADAETLFNRVQRDPRLQSKLAELPQELGAQMPNPANLSRTLDFLEVLAETIETKDRFMRGHARRVAFYASMIGEKMGLAGTDLHDVRIAGFLHDLGKVGVPSDLLLRAGALERDERQLVERHPEIGSRLLEPLGIEASLTLAIRHHHEWWDGTGYPDGMAGEEIPVAARIVAIADAFDAMSCDRPYRTALPRDVVVSELYRFSGTQFDPTAVKHLIGILETSSAGLDIVLLAEAVASPPKNGESYEEPAEALEKR